jgi:hypothetical protein
MKIKQEILDELRNQAARQSQRNYKCVEVDCRTLLAMIHEIERHRLVVERQTLAHPAEPE